MAINRAPLYRDGLMLVGDSAGMVNPFNGEGISYAMESAEMAARAIVDARARGFGSPGAELAFQSYPNQVKQAWGGYYRLMHDTYKIQWYQMYIWPFGGWHTEQVVLSGQVPAPTS